MINIYNYMWIHRHTLLMNPFTESAANYHRRADVGIPMLVFRYVISPLGVLELFAKVSDKEKESSNAKPSSWQWFLRILLFEQKLFLLGTAKWSVFLNIKTIMPRHFLIFVSNTWILLWYLSLFILNNVVEGIIYECMCIVDTYKSMCACLPMQVYVSQVIQTLY